MLSEDVKIKYSGFEPTHDFRSALDILLNELHLKAPSQSFIKATFSATNGIFEGVIKVTSVAENFVVNASDKTLSGVKSKLFDTLASQLEKWKSLRCL